MKQVHSSTHPARSRKRKAAKAEESNYDRAPDTTKKLVKSEVKSENWPFADAKMDDAQASMLPKAHGMPKPAKPPVPFKYMTKELHCDGLRLFQDNSIQGYPWNGMNSCWFDCSLEALLFCFLHLGKSFIYASHALESPEWRLLCNHMEARLRIYDTVDTIPEITGQLSDLRDKLASDLNLDLKEQNNPLVYLTD